MQNSRTPEGTTSPARRTRQQEKEELQHFNDRFVTYIDHVRKLREDKVRVDVAYEQLQNKSFEETSQVRRVYDRELEDARLLIDETAREKARYQLLANKNGEKVATLESELKDLNDDYSKAQQELADAKLSLEDSERQRRVLSSDRVTAQHKIQELEDELEDLRSQIKKLQDTLEQETLAKVDLQNQIQSLKEDMAFRKKMYDENVRKQTTVTADSVKYKYTEEIDSDDYFSERLQAAIDEARDEIEKETEQYRQDLEKAYKGKLNMLEKQASLDASTISRQNTEIRQLNASLSQTNRTVSSLQDDKDRLELLLREKTEELGTIKELHSDELARLLQEMRTLRMNYDEKIKEYEELLDLRIKLEQEISTLAALLAEEENRLNISSTPTRDKRKRAVDKDGPRSKKHKKQVDSTSSSAGGIQICDVDPDGRYIEIKNMSEKIEALGGFKIVHEVENTGEKVEFRFHSKSKLQGGASVTVWAAGADDAVHSPPTDIIWKSAQNWGQGPKTLTSLCTKTGEIVATYTQRKEVSISESPTSSSQIQEPDETDTDSRSFPYIPTPPVQVRQTPTGTPDEPPPTQDEQIFHQQEDPVGQPDREKNCVIS